MESGNERSKMDGYPKRQTKGAELCGAGEKVPHGSADSKEVGGFAGEATVHADRVKTVETGQVQAADRPVVGGGAVLGGVDPGKVAGARIRWEVQHREGVCAREEKGFGRESDGAL